MSEGNAFPGENPKALVRELIEATTIAQVIAIRDRIAGASLLGEDLIQGLNGLVGVVSRDGEPLDIWRLIELLKLHPNGLKSVRRKLAEALGISLNSSEVFQKQPEQPDFSADYDAERGYWTFKTPRGTVVLRFKYDWDDEREICVINTDPTGAFGFIKGQEVQLHGDEIDSFETSRMLRGDMHEFLKEVIKNLGGGLTLRHLFDAGQGKDGRTYEGFVKVDSEPARALRPPSTPADVDVERKGDSLVIKYDWPFWNLTYQGIDFQLRCEPPDRDRKAYIVVLYKESSPLPDEFAEGADERNKYPSEDDIQVILFFYLDDMKLEHFPKGLADFLSDIFKRRSLTLDKMFNGGDEPKTYALRPIKNSSTVVTSHRIVNDPEQQVEPRRPLLTFRAKTSPSDHDRTTFNVFADGWTKVLPNGKLFPRPRIRVSWSDGSIEKVVTLVLTEDFALDDCPGWLWSTLNRALGNGSSIRNSFPVLERLQHGAGDGFVEATLQTLTPAGIVDVEIPRTDISPLAPQFDPELCTSFVYDSENSSQDEIYCTLTYLGVCLRGKITKMTDKSVSNKPFPIVEVIEWGRERSMDLGRTRKYRFPSGKITRDRGYFDSVIEFFEGFQMLIPLHWDSLIPNNVLSGQADECHAKYPDQPEAIAEFNSSTKQWTFDCMGATLKISVFPDAKGIKIDEFKKLPFGLYQSDYYAKGKFDTAPLFLRQFLKVVCASTKGLTLDKIFEQATIGESAEYWFLTSRERLKETGRFAFYHEGQLITLSAGRDGASQFLSLQSGDLYWNHFLGDDLASLTDLNLSGFEHFQVPVEKALKVAGLEVSNFFDCNPIQS